MKSQNLDCEHQLRPNLIIDASITLNKNKDEVIIQKSRIQIIIKHFCGKTFISQSIALDPSQIKAMNAIVYEDLMIFIANYVNQQDMNLVICFQDVKNQNENNLLKFILKHSIIVDQGYYQSMLKEIEIILLNIHEKIQEICFFAYSNGDHKLEDDLRDLLIQYKNIL